MLCQCCAGKSIERLDTILLKVHRYPVGPQGLFTPEFSLKSITVEDRKIKSNMIIKITNNRTFLDKPHEYAPITELVRWATKAV